DLAFTVLPFAITSTVDLNSAAFLTNIPAGLACNPLAFFMLTFFSICKTSKIYSKVLFTLINLILLYIGFSKISSLFVAFYPWGLFLSLSIFKLDLKNLL